MSDEISLLFVHTPTFIRQAHCMMPFILRVPDTTYVGSTSGTYSAYYSRTDAEVARHHHLQWQH